MNNAASLSDLVQFFHDAILVAVLTGAILGPVGLFLHLRRSLFLGAALPQVAGFSFVLANVLGVPSWVSALITILIFSIFTSWTPRQGTNGLPLETMIALAYSVSMAGTVLLLAFTQAEAHAAELLLKGSVLAATCRDTQLLFWFGLPLVVVLFLLRRVLYLVSLDPETARTMGVPVRRYETLLFLALGLAITLTLGEAGALACFAFLLLPALGALAVCRHVAALFLVSALFGAAGALGGLLAALAFDLPAGPAMTIVMLLIWLPLLVWQRWRG